MKLYLENPARGGQTYVSPSLDLFELNIEGVICASGNGTIDPATEDDWGLL